MTKKIVKWFNGSKGYGFIEKGPKGPSTANVATGLAQNFYQKKGISRFTRECPCFFERKFHYVL
jgi:hypothetical protein